MKPSQFSSFDKQYYISLTTKCNWNCWYCDFRDIKPKKVADLDYVLSVFETLKKVTKNDPKVEYLLEGGEIGLLDEDYLKALFNSGLSGTGTYAITTNGLFLERDYQNKFEPYIHYILYHVIDDLREPIKIKDYKVDPSIEFFHTVVVYHENVDAFIEFVKINPDKVIFPHLLQPRRHDLASFLTREDFQKLYMFCRTAKNVPSWFTNRLEKILNNKRDLTFKRHICANLYTQPEFDLVRKRIYRCCISMSGNYVEISEENISRLYKNKALFPPIDKVCNNCIANFLWHDFRFEKNKLMIVKTLIESKKLYDEVSISV